jgi:hypothetical protein
MLVKGFGSILFSLVLSLITVLLLLLALTAAASPTSIA